MHISLTIRLLFLFGLVAATTSNTTDSIPTPSPLSPHELVKRGCVADACCAAITGTKYPSSCRKTHVADCTSLLGTSTIYPIVTSTYINMVFKTITTKAETHSSTAPATMKASGKLAAVTYVSECQGSTRWASACTCWGVMAAAVMGGPSTLTRWVDVTSTVVVSTSSASSLLRLT
jgi:hypothetical protein